MKISRTSNFKRDYKKFKKKHYDMDKLAQVIKLIINGEKETLRTQYHDHMLKGHNMLVFVNYILRKTGCWSIK